MKKLVIAILVLCVAAASVLGFTLGKDGTIPAPAAVETPAAAELSDSESGTENADVVQPEQLDWEAVYALHEPDEVVLTVGGKDVTWGEYFYYLFHQGQSVESYFATMAMYGMDLGWSDEAEEGSTYADLTLESAAATAQSLSAMLGFAEENGVELTEEDRANIEEKTLADIEAACGEGATREDFDAYIEKLYLPAELYDRMNVLSVLYQEGYIKLYGENGEKLSDDEAIAYLEDNAYMSANHILLMTLDPATYESLDEETKAEKLAQAEAIAAELQAITDQNALLVRFAELKEEYDEDSGKAAYPDGYVFQPGEMVSEFEEAVKAQEVYQVSDPVESAYGYHVILTLPLDADAVLQYSSSGQPMTARSLAANAAYSQAADAFTVAQELIFAQGFEQPNLLDYVK